MSCKDTRGSGTSLKWLNFRNYKLETCGFYVYFEIFPFTMLQRSDIMCIIKQWMIYKGDTPLLTSFPWCRRSFSIWASKLQNDNSQQTNLHHVYMPWFKTLLPLLLTSCLIILTRSKMRFVLESAVSWDIKPSPATVSGLLRFNRKMSP